MEGNVIMSSETDLKNALLGESIDIKVIKHISDLTISRLATSAPATPVSGSVWWDEANNKLMIYNATTAAWKEEVFT